MWNGQRALQEQVPFLSEIAPCCSGTDTDTGGIVHMINFDGVFLELVGDLALSTSLNTARRWKFDTQTDRQSCALKRFDDALAIAVRSYYRHCWFGRFDQKAAILLKLRLTRARCCPACAINFWRCSVPSHRNHSACC